MQYIRPKFKISQKIWVIIKDTIIEIEVQSICSYGKEISYLSDNKLYKENICFSSKEEAEDFMENSIRIPDENELLWIVEHHGINAICIEKATCFFKDNLKKPYNATYKTKNCLNANFSNFYENVEEAIIAFKNLRGIK